MDHSVDARVAADAPAKRVLDPMERSSEILFGLIMALTFTGSISAAEGKREEIRMLLFGAIGCNVAWGIVDATMYLMSCLVARGAAWRAARSFRAAAGPAEARGVIAGLLPPGVSRGLDASVLESMRVSLARELVDPPRPRLHAEDWRGALGVFLLVTLSTFPVVVPFLLTNEPERALRLSNAVAIAMLFVVGRAYGKAAGLRPWAMGIAMVTIGGVLVALTIALGG